MAPLPAEFAATSENAPIDAIIIGAGPAGVVSLRNLLKVNLNAISIEDICRWWIVDRPYSRLFVVAGPACRLGIAWCSMRQ